MPCSNAWSQTFVLESRAFDSKTAIHTSSFNSTHFTIKSKINDLLGKEGGEGRIEMKERRRYLWESSLAWHEELRGQTFCKGNGKRRGEWDSELNLWMTVVFVILGIDLCLLVSLFKLFSVPYKSTKRNEDWCSHEKRRVWLTRRSSMSIQSIFISLFYIHSESR